MRTIPVIICVDVEPEKREIDVTVPEDWRGFEATLAFWDTCRPQLAAATPGAANFSWFFRMDPQIERAYGRPLWVADRYGAALEHMERAGDELGLHTHAGAGTKLSASGSRIMGTRHGSSIASSGRPRPWRSISTSPASSIWPWTPCNSRR